MRYLIVPEIFVIYAEIAKVSSIERRDVQSIGGLESALAQPQQTFDGTDLYQTVEAKAAALLYSLCQNHPFADGNKRVAFLAARIFLRLNGLDIHVETSEARGLMYSVAKGEIPTDKIAAWIGQRVHPYRSD